MCARVYQHSRSFLRVGVLHRRELRIGIFLLLDGKRRSKAESFKSGLDEHVTHAVHRGVYDLHLRTPVQLSVSKTDRTCTPECLESSVYPSHILHSHFFTCFPCVCVCAYLWKQCCWIHCRYSRCISWYGSLSSALCEAASVSHDSAHGSRFSSIAEAIPLSWGEMIWAPFSQYTYHTHTINQTNLWNRSDGDVTR